MYLSFVHGEIDVVVGCEIAELFHDVLHLDDNLALIHMAHFSHSLYLL